MDNSFTKCSVCGAVMETSVDLSTGKPFRVQMCSDACMWEAFGIVTRALKKGVRPNFKQKEADKRGGRGRNLTPKERYQIVKMYIDGMTKAEIARKIGRSPALVGQVLRKEWANNEWSSQK